MRNTEKVRRSAAPNLLVQFPLAELTLQLVVDPSKSRRSIPARADGKSWRPITAKADGRSQQEPTARADGWSRHQPPHPVDLLPPLLTFTDQASPPSTAPQPHSSLPTPMPTHHYYLPIGPLQISAPTGGCCVPFAAWSTHHWFPRSSWSGSLDALIQLPCLWLRRYSKARDRAAVGLTLMDLVCCHTLQGHNGKVGALEMTLPFPPVQFMWWLRFCIVVYDWKCWVAYPTHRTIYFLYLRIAHLVEETMVSSLPLLSHPFESPVRVCVMTIGEPANYACLCWAE
jgi:hypothetical protein